MADTTVTIASSGADYTTIGAAITASDVTSGSWIMQITDTRNYPTQLLISATTGTPSATNRLVLTVDANSRHSGKFYDGSTYVHARFIPSTAARIYVQDSYVEISHFEITALTNTVGNMMRKESDCTGFWMHHCLLNQNTSTYDYMQLYHPGENATDTVYFDNNLFVGGTRIFNVKNDTSVTSGNLEIYFDHCGMYANGLSSSTSVLDRNCDYVNSTLDIYMYNCWLNNAGNTSPEIFSQSGSAAGATTINGSHNVYGTTSLAVDVDITDNLTNSISSYDVYDTSTSDGVLIVDEDEPWNFDFNATPLVATGAGVNRILGAGTNRIGSEPFASQDFSVDIAGNTRIINTGYIDIGAFQITERPPGFKYWNGSTWADSVSVKNWNGTAWVDVTAVKYWNGSAWTDAL